MKKIYSSIFAVSALFAAASCQVEIESFEENAPVTVNGMTVTASMGAETKTMLHENGVSTHWTENDVISVFDSKKEDNNRRFEINKSSFPAATATFSCTEEFTMPQNDQPDPLVVALYPYQENAYCDFFYYDRNYITGITIPVEQTAAEGGFDNTATFALATGKLSTKDELTFNNLYSLLKITLAEDGVKKVTVSVGEGEYIAGAAKVQLNLVEGPAFNGGTLSAVADGGSQSVSLVCEEGFATDKTYYLAVAPGTYSTITVALDDVVVKTIDTEKTLAPNTIYGLKNLKNPTEISSVENLKEFIADDEAGNIAKLTTNIEMSEILVIDRDMVLDGNNHTLTSSAGRAINVSGANDVTIKNMTINASGERGINVIQKTKKVTIQNVTVSAANYAVNVASSAPNATIIINSSDLSGLNVVNIAATGTTVDIKDTDIVCTDNNANEGYGCISINEDAPDSRVTVTGGSINIEGSNTNESFAGSMTPEGAEIIFNDVDGVTTIEDCHFYIDYGDNSYASATLSEILKKAKDEDTIVLSKNYSINEALVYDLENNITLDLNGKTITSSGDGIEITAGTLTITGNGTVEAGEGDQWVAVWANGGDAIIENGTYSVGADAEGKTNDCIYAKGGTITINGGTFSNTGEYDVNAGGVVINAHNTVDNSHVIVNAGTFNPATGCVAYEVKDVEEGRVEWKVGE